MGVISKAKSDIDQFATALRTTSLAAPTLDAPVEQLPLQRLREVRLRNELSVGQMAMLLGVSPSQVWADEEPTADLSLSTITKWANALDVPVHELLIEHQSNMGLVGMTPMQLSRVAAIASAMFEQGDDDGTMNMIRRLVQQLEQLQESRE